MCGRYTDTKRDKQFLVRLGFNAEFDFHPRFNIAPTQSASIITSNPSGHLDLKQARWGLIPSWASDEKIGNRLVNARSETVKEKPAFRQAYRKRRCLVLSDGFYEWPKTPRGKQPIYIRMQGGTPFAFGGLWERWRQGDAEVESFCLLTLEPNELLSQVHNRMPLILNERDFPCWLDSESSGDSVDALLQPFPAPEMEFYPVSDRVNSARHEHPSCIERVDLVK